MAEPAVKLTADGARDQSIGTLVSQAIGDVSTLFKAEFDLAKLELKADARRVGTGVALLGIAAFVGCLVLMVLCFAYAYGLIAAGIWAWAAFLIVAGTCIILAALAVLIGYLKFRGLTGFRRTRQTVQEDLTLLRRDDAAPAPAAPSAG